MYKILQKRIHKAKYGCTCAFVPLDRYKGVKLYRYKYDRDYAFAMQQEAAKFKLGPKVIKKIQLAHALNIETGWGNCKFKYGYITQRAKVSSYGEADVLSNKQYNWLCNKMEKHGFRTDDLHSDNIGLINKKPVCIDFDRGSMA